MMTVRPIVFLVDVDNTLLDNDRIQNDLDVTLSVSLAQLAGIGTGPFSKSSSLLWATVIISAPCNVTGSNTREIFTCFRCRHSL